MTKAKSKTLRFTHIYLENWRNFASVDIDLQRRVFLAGPNASGKSNFLDVFRFLHDIVAVGGGFQEAVRKRGGVSKLRCLAARRYSDIMIKVRVGSDIDENFSAWEYELCFNQDKQRQPVIKKERVARNGSEILMRPDEEDGKDKKRLTQTNLEQVRANQEFREMADFFSTVRYFHIVPQLVRDPERSVGRKKDPYGEDFLVQIAETPERTQRSRLLKIEKALCVAVPKLKQLELFRDNRGTPHLRGKYEHWRPQGGWQNEEQFSDGTLRLMGLLWASLDGSGPLLLEEPELSLHPEVIQYIPQMFARIQRKYDRQILISTHSSDMLLDDGIALDEVLLLLPEDEGTSIRAASEFREMDSLLEGGSNLADVVMPLTRPDKVSQLPLFAD
jgi:predicted ATPase